MKIYKIYSQDIREIIGYKILKNPKEKDLIINKASKKTKQKISGKWNITYYPKTLFEIKIVTKNTIFVEKAQIIIGEGK